MILQIRGDYLTGLGEHVDRNAGHNLPGFVERMVRGRNEEELCLQISQSDFQYS